MADYKTTRKYKCPYCEFRGTRNELVDHVEDKHATLLPEGYTAARAVYDFVNGKNYGICMMCKSKVYKWNDKIDRYYNLCEKPACRKAVRERALKNHIKVHDCESLLNDPEQQEKMLAARKISGTYTFTDGGKVTYTGSYEKKCLEFMDKVIEVPSTDIQAPGPILKYTFEGKEHFWITDIYYIPGNLLIEVKDGGSNPNNRSMQSYRDKQVAKEIMVTELGTFNYIRLTNNQFDQLLAVFADMKNEALENPNPKAIIHINEEVGGIPPHRPPEAYIVPYGMTNVFDGFAYADSESDEVVVPKDGEFKKMPTKEFYETYKTAPRMYYVGKDLPEKIREIREQMSTALSNSMVFAEMLVGNTLEIPSFVFYCDKFKYFSGDTEKKVCSYLENSIMHEYNMIIQNNTDESNIIGRYGNHVMLCKGMNGYYAVTPNDFYMVSNYYDTKDDLLASGCADIMDNAYAAHMSVGNLTKVGEDYDEI